MQNILTAAFNEPNNKTLTENLAVARKTTNSKVLDLFSQIGGFRVGQASPEVIVKQVMSAFAEDRELTLKTLFYSRDIRGGQGEREVFRIAIRTLALFRPDTVRELVQHIPTYGRWDDLYCLLGTDVENEVWATIRKQWKADTNSETATTSLMAKWLASVTTSSPVTRAQGRATAKALDLTERNYRKTLSALRSKIGIIEQKMSANDWEGIVYEHVPSQANMLYKTAFYKHEPTRRQAYLDALTKGETKVNASTQFPYELIHKLVRGSENDNALVEAMWKAQPDYFNGVKENSLVVADVSGSMSGLPLEVCLSLAIYTAERNTGPWHNKFITFSERPTMQSLVGTTLAARVANLNQAHWDMNTDIQKVFEVILVTAVANKVAPTEMVKRLYIVSDMEFDQCTGRNKKDRTLFAWLQKKYKDAGYKMPELVFWNVSARNTQFPMSMDDRGFLNVSGCSPSIFKSVVGRKFLSAYDLMLEVLESERYEVIK